MTLNPTIETYLDADYFEVSLRSDVQKGLTGDFKELPPKWFYDDRGSELFEQITQLDEYYPTEAEREILTAHSDEIARTTKANTLIELGSGVADKTTTLLDAMNKEGNLERFVPFDVSEGALRSSAETILKRYPGLEIHGIVGDFEHHLNKIPTRGTQVVALLGGTLGNFGPTQRKTLLADIAEIMRPGDSFLLGTDLVKDRTRLVQAYDDSKGITAEFNKNILAVLNDRLGANFNLESFSHIARFDETNEWIEMILKSNEDQTVFIKELDLEVSFAAGEEFRTEISAKFRRETVGAELKTAGLVLEQWWTDQNNDYALSLSTLA